MNTDVKEAKFCPHCGKPMPSGALAGLCPACLLAQGAETETASSDGGEPAPSPSLKEIAALFPQLEILAFLGAGGMGAVYKARQPALDRIVALKILPGAKSSATNFEERFSREARALARLSHPNIVAVHEFGLAGGLHFFIMEFVDGANLRLLEQGGRLSAREALQLVPQICDALQYAHDQGVVHRDIKPENVLVDRKGRVKIADFGLAKILGLDPASARLTAEGQVMGTPHYMAPEQLERPLTVDHRADIFSLGVVLYEMLTGDLPLGKFSPPSRKVQVDVRFDEVVLRALENDPARRYQQASEVKSGVESISGPPTPATPAAGTPPSAPNSRPVYWGSFPLAIEREGVRTINRKEVWRAWAIVFGLLTLGFAFISAITGRSLMGWLGLMGWPSLSVRAVISIIVVAWGARQALGASIEPGPARTARGTVILSPKIPWWRRPQVVAAELLLLAATWALFQGSHLELQRPPTVPDSVPVPRVEASAEQWSPSVMPGENPDPSQVLSEAEELVKTGDYESALQRHLWYHNHALEFQKSATGVRLSFALADWIALSRRYPKARDALIEIRDHKTRAVDEGHGYSDLFSDVASINHYLEEEGATAALFRRIHESDPALARQCIYYAKEALARSREYDLYLTYLPNAEAEFLQIQRSWDEANQRAESQKNPESFRKMADMQFVGEARRLIAVLAGAGRTVEAEKIRAQAIALVDDAQLHGAATNASTKNGR